MSFKQKQQYTKRSDYWNTPSNIYNKLMKEGWVDYNPEGSYYEPFSSEVGRFKDKRVFINPPFSLLGKEEMYETIEGLIRNGNEILFLMPSRTDTRYFHRFLEFEPAIYFFKGRLSFNDKGSAPFPTMLLLFNGDNKGVYKALDRELNEIK